jgi:hypothetical protein
VLKPFVNRLLKIIEINGNPKPVIAKIIINNHQISNRKDLMIVVNINVQENLSFTVLNDHHNLSDLPINHQPGHRETIGQNRHDNHVVSRHGALMIAIRINLCEYY